jgi:hypothetical protein
MFKRNLGAVKDRIETGCCGFFVDDRERSLAPFLHQRPHDFDPPHHRFAPQPFIRFCAAGRVCIRSRRTSSSTQGVRADSLAIFRDDDGSVPRLGDGAVFVCRPHIVATPA